MCAYVQENGCLALRAEKIIYKILIFFDISFWICDNLLSITTKTHTLAIFSLNSPKSLILSYFHILIPGGKVQLTLPTTISDLLVNLTADPQQRTTNEPKTQKIYWRTTTITNWFQIQNTDSSVGQQKLHLEKRLFPTIISSRIVVYSRC